MGYAQLAQQQGHPTLYEMHHYGSGMAEVMPYQQRPMTEVAAGYFAPSPPASGYTPPVYASYGQATPAAATRQERFEQSLRASTADVYHQQFPGGDRQAVEGINSSPMAQRKGTNPNQMDEDALRAARIEYHQEKKRIVEMQMQRQRMAEA